MKPYYGSIPIRLIDYSKYRDSFVRSHLSFRIIFHEKGGRKQKGK